MGKHDLIIMFISIMFLIAVLGYLGGFDNLEGNDDTRQGQETDSKNNK